MVFDSRNGALVDSLTSHLVGNTEVLKGCFSDQKPQAIVSNGHCLCLYSVEQKSLDSIRV